MKLLAIDTATDACSVALFVDGELTERYELTPRDHARLLIPMISGLLAESAVSVRELDAIAFGRGPGSFTGVRIATGVVQGVAYAADLPVVPVSDLAAIAQAASRLHGATCVLSCLDARLHEIYWGLYGSDARQIMQALGPEALSAPGSVRVSETVFAAGSGWSAYPSLQSQVSLAGIDSELLPRARDILTLALPRVLSGETVSAAEAVPSYLRNEVAWQKS